MSGQRRDLSQKSICCMFLFVYCDVLPYDWPISLVWLSSEKLTILISELAALKLLNKILYSPFSRLSNNHGIVYFPPEDINLWGFSHFTRFDLHILIILAFVSCVVFFTICYSLFGIIHLVKFALSPIKMGRPKKTKWRSTVLLIRWACSCFKI